MELKITQLPKIVTLNKFENLRNLRDNGGDLKRYSCNLKRMSSYIYQKSLRLLSKSLRFLRMSNIAYRGLFI